MNIEQEIEKRAKELIKAIAVSARNVKILESQNLPFTHGERDMNWKGKMV